MKIAYLVFAYKNPKLIQRVVKRLEGEDSAFFIHIDAKCDITPFLALRGKNLVFTDDRRVVYWAEFSGVEAILALMQQALAANVKYDYFVLLSGSEYPLKSREYIHQFFGNKHGQEFISMAKMPSVGKPLSRITEVRFPSSRPAIRFIFRLLAQFNLTRRDYRRYLGDLEPYSGLTWWALTREACQYLVEFDKINSKIRGFFEKSFAPEESYFHTILGNSRFAPKIQANVMYEDWREQRAHPKPLDAPHLAALEQERENRDPDRRRSSEFLFARKFSDERLELTSQLDAAIEREKPRGVIPTGENGTRTDRI